jgi:hypothetical protein
VSGGFLAERPNRPPTIVVKTGELPAPRWRWVPPVLIALLLGVPLAFGVFDFFTNLIEPVHRQIGQPFTVQHVTYRVESVVTAQDTVVVTMHATNVDPKQGCAGVDVFRLEDDGQSYVEHVETTLDGHKVVLPASGCFNLVTVPDPTWTITYHAPPGATMSLVVQAIGGFHRWGLDEYAVVSLKH